MKTVEEILNEVAEEYMINIHQMVTTKQLAIIAMKRYAELYHKNEVEKLNMSVTKERFVPVKELSNLMKQRNYIDKKIFLFNTQHCRNCGDTQPKHGFYPLWGMGVGEDVYQTSGLICNRCARTDEEYEKIFGEPKEKF